MIKHPKDRKITTGVLLIFQLLHLELHGGANGDLSSTPSKTFLLKNKRK